MRNRMIPYRQVHAHNTRIGKSPASDAQSRREFELRHVFLTNKSVLMAPHFQKPKGEVTGEAGEGRALILLTTYLIAPYIPSELPPLSVPP